MEDIFVLLSLLKNGGGVFFGNIFMCVFGNGFLSG